MLPSESKLGKKIVKLNKNQTETTVLQKVLLEPLFIWSGDHVIFLVICHSMDHHSGITCPVWCCVNGVFCTAIVQVPYIAT